MIQLLVVFLTLASAPTIIEFADFEHKMIDDGIFTDTMTTPGILEVDREYYVIQRVEFKQKDFSHNNTEVDVVVGYAFQKGDKMIRPPIGENITNKEATEFLKNMGKYQEEFRKESTINDSYEFTMNAQKPFYVKFPIKLEQIGLYTFQFYQKTDLHEGPASTHMGGFAVVEKYSKALDEDGHCRTEGLARVIKHDYSTVACTSVETFHELRNRGWASS